MKKHLLEGVKKGAFDMALLTRNLKLGKKRRLLKFRLKLLVWLTNQRVLIRLVWKLRLK